MATGSEFQPIGLAWCKKDDVRPSHSLLLVSSPIAISTDSILVALCDVIQHLTGVSRREESGKTLLLLEFDRNTSDVVLPPSGELKVTLSGREVVFAVHRFTRV